MAKGKTSRGINPMGTSHPKPGGVPAADEAKMTARTYSTRKGESPKAAIIDGPYGGKKPQS